MGLEPGQLYAGDQGGRIAAAGKSSCFLCPSMTQQEILYLKKHYPDLFRRAVALEENAMPYLKTVKGLGRNYSWKERFGEEKPC